MEKIWAVIRAFDEKVKMKNFNINAIEIKKDKKDKKN